MVRRRSRASSRRSSARWCSSGSGAGRPSSEPTLAVHASARHMHVSREDLDILFGPGHELTVDRPLYQEGNFAAKETVTLIGPRSRLISNLRILGPMRKESQIELAFTDAIGLGLDAPDPPLGQHRRHAGRVRDGPEGHGRTEGRRDPRRHPRAHESGRGGALRREAGRHDEAARRRRRRA